MVIKVPINSKEDFMTSYAYILLMLNKQAVSESELELLTQFLDLPDRFKYRRFSSSGKKKVIEAYALLNKKLSLVNLNNKLYSLIKKGILRRDEDGVIQIPDYVYKPYLEFLNHRKVTVNLEFYEKARKD